MLAFDAATHIYTFTPANGETTRLLSVTEVLRRAGLVDVAHYTDDARVRGSRVHEAIALDHDGMLNEVEYLDVLPWVETWRRFVAYSGFVVVGFEQRVADVVRGYAGTYDVRGYFAADFERPVILDIKTGTLPAWVGAQLAGYARCLPTFHARYALHLTPDRYTLTEYRDRADEALFLSALTVARWQVTHGL